MTTTSSKPVLVPVDFAAHSRAALLCGAEVAEKLGAELVVLHVVHDPGDAPGYYKVEGREDHLRNMQDVAAEMLEAFMVEVRREHPNSRIIQTAKTLLVVGLPANRILETADKISARMIVMGSQGRTGLAHTMLGSKAEHVVRLAPMPVMIVKAPQTEKS